MSRSIHSSLPSGAIHYIGYPPTEQEESLLASRARLLVGQKPASLQFSAITALIIFLPPCVDAFIMFYQAGVSFWNQLVQSFLFPSDFSLHSLHGQKTGPSWDNAGWCNVYLHGFIKWYRICLGGISGCSTLFISNISIISWSHQ